jgi:fructokinase
MSLIISIGEILWDRFPDRKELGGASANFLWHSQQLGHDTCLVSAVGNDDPGDEILAVLKRNKLSTQFIQQSDAYKTGEVNVVLDADGKPTYEIVENRAWDNIEFSDELAELAADAQVVHFGSLPQRCETSRKTIQELLQNCSHKCIKIFDINLRQHYFSEAVISDSLEQATVLKLSDEELPLLQKYYELPESSVISALRQLQERFNLHMIAYTCGAEGSILVAGNQLDEHSGISVDAVDSVGAGDSFSATICAGILAGKSLHEINIHANKVAGFVCTQRGATPVLPVQLT